MNNRKSLSVAAYIKTQISVCGVAQKDIAAALDYDNPNVISMIKNGTTKLPLTKVGPLAKILEVDPVHLLRLTMTEYCPETWQSIQHVIGRSLITANELALIELVRKTCGDVDLALKDKAERDALAAIVEDIAFNQHKPGFGR
jgi:hypothetical protein